MYQLGSRSLSGGLVLLGHARGDTPAVADRDPLVLRPRPDIRAEAGDASFSPLTILRTLQRLLRAWARSPEVRSAYALALAKSGRLETAVEEADVALAAAPDNGLIFLRAARVASASGALERATALLRRAAKAQQPCAVGRSARRGTSPARFGRRAGRLHPTIILTLKLQERSCGATGLAGGDSPVRALMLRFGSVKGDGTCQPE